MQFNTEVHLDMLELRAVRAAIEQYLTTCEERIRAGEDIPYEAHKRALTALRSRLVPDVMRNTPEDEDHGSHAPRRG